MKKLTAIILSLLFVLSLTACGGSTDTSSPVDTGSEDTSSEDSLEGGIEIPYSAFVDGYIDHKGIWEFGFVSHNKFQCMTDELLYLPAGTSIMCNEKLAIYCYLVNNEGVNYKPDLCEKLGQTIVPDLMDVKHDAPVSVVLDRDYLVRFSVMGKLTDVCIFAPKELQEKIRLVTEKQAIEEQILTH